MSDFVKEVFETVDLSQCTSYSPIKNPRLFALREAPQFQTNELTLYIPSSWWEKQPGRVPAFKDKHQILSNELDCCFVIANSGKEDFFDTLSDINQKSEEWRLVNCNVGLAKDFHGFLHKNGRSFVGLGPFSKLSNTLPRPDLFCTCTRSKVFFESQMSRLPCTLAIIRDLVTICTQKKMGANKRLAESMGISESEVSKLKKPDYYRISSNILIKAWNWFRNTSVQEIMEMFDISDAEFMNVFLAHGRHGEEKTSGADATDLISESETESIAVSCPTDKDRDKSVTAEHVHLAADRCVTADEEKKTSAA